METSATHAIGPKPVLRLLSLLSICMLGLTLAAWVGSYWSGPLELGLNDRLNTVMVFDRGTISAGPTLWGMSQEAKPFFYRYRQPIMYGADIYWRLPGAQFQIRHHPVYFLHWAVRTSFVVPTLFFGIAAYASTRRIRQRHYGSNDTTGKKRSSKLSVRLWVALLLLTAGAGFVMPSIAWLRYWYYIGGRKHTSPELQWAIFNCVVASLLFAAALFACLWRRGRSLPDTSSNL